MVGEVEVVADGIYSIDYPARLLDTGYGQLDKRKLMLQGDRFTGAPQTR